MARDAEIWNSHSNHEKCCTMTPRTNINTRPWWVQELSTPYQLRGGALPEDGGPGRPHSPLLFNLENINSIKTPGSSSDSSYPNPTSRTVWTHISPALERAFDHFRFRGGEDWRVGVAACCQATQSCERTFPRETSDPPEFSFELTFPTIKEG